MCVVLCSSLPPSQQPTEKRRISEVSPFALSPRALVVAFPTALRLAQFDHFPLLPFVASVRPTTSLSTLRRAAPFHLVLSPPSRPVASSLSLSFLLRPEHDVVAFSLVEREAVALSLRWPSSPPHQGQSTTLIDTTSSFNITSPRRPAQPSRTRMGKSRLPLTPRSPAPCEY